MLRKPNNPPRTVVKLSDSTIKDYQRCPRRWAYNRLLGADNGEDRWNLIYGTGVHAGLEAIHQGAMLKNATDIGLYELQKDGKGEETPDMMELLPAHLDGYTRHFWPQFDRYWRTAVTTEGQWATEQWFDYPLDEFVMFRGKRDLFAVSRADETHTLMADFKTTSMKDGGDLGRMVRRNPQLARYCVSYCREFFEWPRQIALIFLQKPKLKNFQSVLSACRENPDLYSMKSEYVTPQFAQYAMSIERSDLAYGWQMFGIQRAYDERGLDAFDAVPANFDGCRAYNRDCGYLEGCYGGKPLHKHVTV